MNQWKEILEYCLNKDLAKIILSNPRQKGGARKVEIRPVLLKDQLVFQASEYTEKQVWHYNLPADKLYDKVADWMENMKQLEALHPAGRVHVLISKKGKMTVKKSKAGCTRASGDLSHDRKKKYILDPAVTVPFLVDLGVQTKDGKIVQARYDKFRQLNRFLEFIEDIALELPKDRETVMIDFGCGKSYLTFAMYYYLHELKGYDVRIIGLDLKEDVIARCQALADKYGYEKLTFLAGDIADYDGVDRVDMVVTLHACDTATDYALDKAVRWGAKVILSVPCCQHELNGQMKSALLEPVFKYGLLKERMAALFTDAIRANLLETAGYRVQVLEFIDMEHTPKNILIRAIKSTSDAADRSEADGQDSVKRLIAELSVKPTLCGLMDVGKEQADE